MNKPPVILVHLALLLVQLIFSVNFLATKHIMKEISPFDWSVVRFFFAGLILLGYCLLLARKFPKFKNSDWPQLILFAFLGMTAVQVLFLYGISKTSVVNASLLSSLIPIFTLVIVVLRGQEKLTLAKGAGFLCALFGILVMRNVESFTLSDQTALGDLLIILSALTVGLYFAFGKKFLQRFDRSWVTTLMFFAAFAQVLPLAMTDGRDFQNLTLTPIMIAAMIFSVVGGTFLAYGLGNWALSHIDAAISSLYIYLQPVFSAFLASSFLGEKLTLRTLVSLVFIIGGFILATLPLGGGTKRSENLAHR